MSVIESIIWGPQGKALSQPRRQCKHKAKAASYGAEVLEPLGPGFLLTLRHRTGRQPRDHRKDLPTAQTSSIAQWDRTLRGIRGVGATLNCQN